MTNQSTPYYLAYEKRYQAVYASGVKLWGHSADDEILIGTLTDWVEKNGLRGKKVVEYACGEGSVGVILSKLGCIYHGVDIAPSAIARSKEALEKYPNATVSLLDMVNERVEGLYDAAVDVMGLHMLVTDRDRKKYLDHVNAGLRANAPALFFRESYRKDLPSHTVDSIEQWVEITGDDYQTPAPRQITVNGKIRTVDIPLIPARAKNKTDYEKEMTESGFVVENFIEMDISNAIVHSATLYVRKSLNDDNKTTDRIGRVRAYIHNIFDSIEDADEKRSAYIHSYGVSHCCALLAAKRGLNQELATVMGLLHDAYAYKTGVTAWHAQNGAELVRVAFKYSLADLFTDDEQTIIKSAIYHHANKDIVHDEYDELLKDSDILQRLSFDTTYEWAYGQRLLRVMQELLLPTPKITVLPKKEAKINPFKQSVVGDIAESLAEKQIAGEKSNTEYLKIIRYFPEDTAFDELKNAWCAAFVYHCCLEAGLSLPIRVPHTAKKTANCRFACVAAWYEWGTENGFCHFEKDGFVPRRGDIVIYNNIIPKEDKPENSTWCDHIGVVVSCDNNRLLVAEGNAGNKNVSGVITRKRDDTIGCYIRIPEDYTYDGWKTDFKTGEIKEVLAQRYND